MSGRTASTASWVLILILMAASWESTLAGEYLENWDSIGQGGDGRHGFTFVPLVPDPDLAAADGTRCEENDPDGSGARPPFRCRPWTGHDWHIHLPENSPASKAFSGDGALQLGVHTSGLPALDSYTSAQLSAAVSPPLTLGHGGGIRRPELTFRHIVSLADDCGFTLSQEGENVDRGVVQVALADPETGEVVSPWRNLRAVENGPTRVASRFFINCKFDPVDDGNTEDDLLPPRFPAEGGGHGHATPADTSSTCYPEETFSRIGDYDSTNVSDVGDAQAGSGERGSMGTGVWVQSRFNMAPYSGRTVRLRFLASTIEINGPDGGAWSSFYFLLGIDLSCLRGWIIDDVRVTGVAEIVTPEPGTASP